MKRLPVFAVIAVCSALAGLSGVAAWAAPASAPAKQSAERHARNAACAKVCGECMISCECVVHSCAERIAAGQLEQHKQLLGANDCAAFCSLCMRLNARNSPMAPAACEACAKACEMCGTSCEKFADAPEMKACAEACVKCAASCREMVKMSAAAGQ